VLQEIDGVSAVISVDVTLATASNGFAVSSVVNPIPVATVVFPLNIARVGDISHDALPGPSVVGVEYEQDGQVSPFT
jgi:hypothetical protein